MALRNEAADISGSSDIGPPPTSRYAEPDSPQKDPNSPSKPPQPEEAPESIPESPALPPAQKPSDTVKEEQAETSPSKTLSTVPQLEASPKNTRPEQPVKSGKRKLAARDEAENIAPATVATITTTNTRRKATILRDKSGNNKTLKELAAMRREERGKQTPAQAPAARKPLSAKSTNDDLTSPKKSANKVAASEKPEKREKPLKPAKAKQAAEKQPRESTKRKIATVDERPPPPPAVAIINPAPEPEPEKQPEPPTTTPSADPDHLSPTPEPKSQPQSRDTPPPADISSQGETSRPSRRSRAHVSYAEPNLRDKMRRPTKELVDAVANGKGRRPESLAPEEIAAMSEGMKREDGGVDLGRIPPVSPPRAEAEGPASPLARKEVEGLPSSVVTERRKRRSSILARDFPSEAGKGAPEDDSLESSLGSLATSESSGDIYDFPAGSPDLEPSGEPAKKGTRRTSRAGDAQEEARPSRKRASINVPRRRADVADVEDGPSEGTRDRSMRRRSTML